MAVVDTAGLLLILYTTVASPDELTLVETTVNVAFHKGQTDDLHGSSLSPLCRCCTESC